VKTIWKYRLPGGPKVTIGMPRGAVVLTVQVQDGEPMLWVKVDPKGKPVKRFFRVFGTGHTISDDKLEYVGTFQMQTASDLWDNPVGAPVEMGAKTLVFHVFEDI